MSVYCFPTYCQRLCYDQNSFQDFPKKFRECGPSSNVETNSLLLSHATSHSVPFISLSATGRPFYWWVCVMSRQRAKCYSERDSIVGCTVRQSWQWVTFCDPWPSTQSQTMAWVDHDYSRIMMSSRLLHSLICNDVQSGILDMAYAVYIFTIHSKSSSLVYILYMAIVTSWTRWKY